MLLDKSPRATSPLLQKRTLSSSVNGVELQTVITIDSDDNKDSDSKYFSSDSTANYHSLNASSQASSDPVGSNLEKIAALQKTKEALKADLACPISGVYVAKNQAVIFNGHLYSKSHLEAWLNKKMVDPLTNMNCHHVEKQAWDKNEAYKAKYDQLDAILADLKQLRVPPSLEDTTSEIYENVVPETSQEIGVGYTRPLA